MSKEDDSSLADVTIYVAWYKREQWDKLLAISADRDLLEDTFGEWIQAANKALAPMQKAGAHCIKVDVDVHKLQEWCRLNDRPLDGESRTAYAIELGRRKFESN